jgi:hypothetical protein
VVWKAELFGEYPDFFVKIEMSAAGDLLENVETKQAVLTISDRIKEYLPSCGLLPHTSLPRGNKRISESRLTPITVSPVRFLKHLLLPFFCLLSSACVPAAVTSSPGAYGRVTDTQSHAPLAHASVTFPGRGPTVTTDAAGLYDLPHTTTFGIVVLLPFEFQTLPLQVSHAGYQTVTVRVETISEHTRQDVELQRQP